MRDILPPSQWKSEHCPSLPWVIGSKSQGSLYSASGGALAPGFDPPYDSWDHPFQMVEVRNVARIVIDLFQLFVFPSEYFNDISLS